MGRNVHPNTTTKLFFNIIIVNNVIKIENNLVLFALRNERFSTAFRALT